MRRLAKEFFAYRRADGKAGLRNHVIVLSIMDNVNPVVRQISQSVRGVIPVTTKFGRGQFGKDNEQRIRTLVGLGINPNVGAVLVVSLEQTSAELVASKIAVSGKPVEIITVQEAGNTVSCVCKGTEKVVKMAVATSMMRREKANVSELMVGLQCGGSDTTSGIASNPLIGVVADKIIECGGTVFLAETSEFLGAERILAKRAVNKKAKNKILEIVKNVENEAKRRGLHIRGANPAPDNFRGGLTTIEEKSLGSILKGGSKTISGVLGYASPAPTSGFFIMDTPSPAVESMTGLVAGGAQLILFSTGVGNTIGNPIAPTVKVTANVDTAKKMDVNIDFDASSIITEGLDTQQVALQLLKEILMIAEGKKTKSEILYQEEIAISRIERSV